MESASWIHNTPSNSLVEQKLRELLLDLGRKQQVVGIQVCAYKDGKVVIDTSAGVLGKDDPRPVQPDSLFPCFSVTKGITAGLVHWLADQGKLSLSAKVASYWPEFAVNGKENITVAHVLNHTAGLQSALADDIKDAQLMCNWEDKLKGLALATPVSAPGEKQDYHTLTFGWLCGSIIEKASGRRFQDLLEEVFVGPLGVSGEFYVGIPAGVETRLASVALDSRELEFIKNTSEALKSEGTVEGGVPGIPTEGVAKASEKITNTAYPQKPVSGDSIAAISAIVDLINTLSVRRAIIPAANGHFSARALARYYAMLATGGFIPPKPASSEPPLGSHPQKPSEGMKSATPAMKNKNKSKNQTVGSNIDSNDPEAPEAAATPAPGKIFSSPTIFNAFTGSGEYSNLVCIKDCLVFKGEKFGLGFGRFPSAAGQDGSSGGEILGFGHPGLGGSTGFCYPTHNFSMAITLNQLTLNQLSDGAVAAQIVRLVTSEMGLPCPSNADIGPDRTGGGVSEN